MQRLQVQQESEGLEYSTRAEDEATREAEAREEGDASFDAPLGTYPTIL